MHIFHMHRTFCLDEYESEPAWNMDDSALGGSSGGASNSPDLFSFKFGVLDRGADRAEMERRGIKPVPQSASQAISPAGIRRLICCVAMFDILDRESCLWSQYHYLWLKLNNEWWIRLALVHLLLRSNLPPCPWFCRRCSSRYGLYGEFAWLITTRLRLLLVVL